MKRFFLSFSALFFATFMLCQNAHADDASAKAFVQSLSDNVLKILSDSSFSQDDKQQKLTRVFTTQVDTAWMAKFVLGRYYNTATDDQRKRYNNVYRDYLVQSYVPKFKEYHGQQFALKNIQSQGDGEYIVQTEIIEAENPSIRIDYRIRQTQSGFKVIDIIAEGISMINTQRSEFASYISKNGMDAFLDRLEGKVKQLNSK